MITDRERSLANLCSTRSRRELSNQVNFESMRAIPILTDGQTFAPRHYRASIDPVHGSRAQQREMPMVRRSEGEKNGNTSESSVHSVFYHARGERSRAMVLGGVLGGFGGGNQSGKKLNITPEERGRAPSFGCGNLGVSSVWRPPKERSRRGLRYVLPGAVPRVSGTNNILTRTRQTRNLCSLGTQCLISAPLKRTF